MSESTDEKLVWGKFYAECVAEDQRISLEVPSGLGGNHFAELLRICQIRKEERKQ